jgi:FixJ family two-component response regulator
MTAVHLVHVIDDDQAARDSLAFLLDTNGFAVEIHESAVAFLDAGSGMQPGCVVTDVRMPGMDGISLLRHLRARGDNRAVIVVTGNADIPLAIEAIEAGAFDFVEKPYEAEMLLGAIRSAFDPQRRASTANGQEETLSRFSTLSDRERQVFEGIVVGRSNGAVGITERSVEVHRDNAMTKMNAAGLADLVRMALTLNRPE